jgi:alpha-galactosidase
MRQNFHLLLLFLFIACASCNNSNPKKEEKVTRQLTPMMGWSSWNNYRINISEDIIKKQADAMISNGMASAGYQFINIDDGFFGGRDKQGNLICHQSKFPSGMRNLSDYLHSKGLKAGMYSDAGANTCAVQWDDDSCGAGVGLYGHDRADIITMFVDWNFDFFKVDWCGGVNLGLDEQIRYTEIGKVLNEIKPSALYNVCRWQFPGKWVTQVADSWRISADIQKNFESIMRIVDLNADLWRYCSPGHFNDMDMLQVGRGMSYEEDKTHFTMWCIMNSPLITGNDLSTMSDTTLSILTNEKLIAINQDSLCYQARRMSDYGETEVWARPLKSTISGEIVVVLLNRSLIDQKIEFNADSLGILSAKRYSTYDLWTGQIQNNLSDSELSFIVPSHGVIALLLKGTANRVNLFQYEKDIPVAVKITEF